MITTRSKRKKKKIARRNTRKSRVKQGLDNVSYGHLDYYGFGGGSQNIAPGDIGKRGFDPKELRDPLNGEWIKLPGISSYKKIRIHQHSDGKYSIRAIENRENLEKHLGSPGSAATAKRTLKKIITYDNRPAPKAKHPAPVYPEYAGSIDPKSIKGIKLLNKASQNELLATLDTLYKKNPKFKETKISVISGQQIKKYADRAAAVTLDKSNTLMINYDTANKIDGLFFGKGWGFTRNLGDVVTHEFGHIAIGHVLNPSKSKDYGWFEKSLAPLMTKHFPDAKTGAPVDGWAYRPPKTSMTKLGSKYGTTSMHEFIAEVFLAYNQGNKNPGIVAIGKMIDKELKK